MLVQTKVHLAQRFDLCNKNETKLAEHCRISFQNKFI